MDYSAARLNGGWHHVRLLQTLSNCIGAVQSGNILLINRSAVATSVRLDRCPLPACLPCPFVSRSVCGRRFSVNLKENRREMQAASSAAAARLLATACTVCGLHCDAGGPLDAPSTDRPVQRPTGRRPPGEPASNSRRHLRPSPRKWPWYT